MKKSQKLGKKSDVITWAAITHVANASYLTKCKCGYMHSTKIVHSFITRPAQL